MDGMREICSRESSNNVISKVKVSEGPWTFKITCNILKYILSSLSN